MCQLGLNLAHHRLSGLVSSVSAFRSSLESALKPIGIALSRWSGASRLSDHLLELRTKPKPTVVYVKENNSIPAFWGLTRNQLKRLRDSGHRWFVVLLDRSSTSGYLLSGGQVDSRVASGLFELSGDGDHKVNDSDLSAGQRFHDLAALVDRVV